MKSANRLPRLFTVTFLLSLCTFGGGYVIVPLMKKKFVEQLGWLDKNEMMDLTAIAQTSPGAIAVNASILVGYRICGIAGAAAAAFATVLPPLCIISLLSLIYSSFRDNIVVIAVMQGMQAGVAAVIADVVVSMGTHVAKERDLLSALLMPAVFVASFFLHINIFIIILCSGALGALRVAFRRLRERKKQHDLS